MSQCQNPHPMTLPLQSNTVFLPVLDDLLSPDLRPVLQTPTVEPPPGTGPGSHFVSASESGGPTPTSITTPMTANKLFIGSMCSSGMSDSMTTCPSMTTSALTIDNGNSGSCSESIQDAASSKIQRWWKRLKAKKLGIDYVDIGAERGKHSIRHMRTEEHILHLEAEVNRLKSALALERKMRSLQMEAIRSLWIQVQKMNSSAPVWDESFFKVTNHDKDNNGPSSSSRSRSHNRNVNTNSAPAPGTSGSK